MKKAFIITTTFLSCVIFILAIVLGSTQTTLSSTSANLESLYQRSFYDLVDNVNNMEVDVSKLMVSNDSTSQQKLLSNIKQTTTDAENDLSLLPINASLIEPTTKFMNQVNGYCTSLISYKNGKIEDEDYLTLSNVYHSIAIIKSELNSLMEKIMQGYKISDNIGSLDNIGDFSLSLSNLANDTIEYPSLIYDGPFSESVMNKKVKGLSENTISENDAENLITKLFNNKITNLNYLGETNGKFVTYDFGVNTDDNKDYFVQITKQGGFLLSMSSNFVKKEDSQLNSNEQTNDNLKTNSEKDTKTLLLDNENSGDYIKNIQNIAVEFAKKIGLSDMESVWSAASQDICYVNLAPVIDDIIMYPDLIKVKINLLDNSIMGWEASAYAYNHVEREDLVPQLTENEAKQLVSNNLNIDTQKLCVIPLDYSGETLAYEFAGTYNGFNYYLYIDAYTGDQVRVLRIIQTDQGELVL